MNPRTQILNRVRRALQTPSPRPDSPSPQSPFAPIPSSELLSRFEKELQKLKADFFLAKNWEEAQSWTRQLAETHQLQRIAATSHGDVLKSVAPLKVTPLSSSLEAGRNLAAADLAVTPCECLVARTGSVVLTSNFGFGRALSVLPPMHLVVARRHQLLADLSDAYLFLQAHYHKLWPSMITFITGPSRTSDIEKTLVLGAHGPKRLFVLLLDF